MKLLLDTHIWIWLHSRREKIGGKVRKQIENPANELYLSPISIWEARHLERTGRLRLKELFDVGLRLFQILQCGLQPREQKPRERREERRDDRQQGARAIRQELER